MPSTYSICQLIHEPVERSLVHRQPRDCQFFNFHFNKTKPQGEHFLFLIISSPFFCSDELLFQPQENNFLNVTFIEQDKNLCYLQEKTLTAICSLNHFPIIYFFEDVYIFRPSSLVPNTLVLEMQKCTLCASHEGDFRSKKTWRLLGQVTCVKSVEGEEKEKKKSHFLANCITWNRHLFPGKLQGPQMSMPLCGEGRWERRTSLICLKSSWFSS